MRYDLCNRVFRVMKARELTPEQVAAEIGFGLSALDSLMFGRRTPEGVVTLIEAWCDLSESLAADRGAAS